MEYKNLIGMILAVTVGILCIGTVMMPILSDASETESTFSNVDGSIAYFDKVGSEDTITFEWDYTNPLVATINGEEVDLPEPSSYYYGLSLIASEGMSYRFYKSGTDNYIIQSIGGSQNAGYYGTASVTNAANLSVTVTADSITNTVSDRAFTTTGNTYVISDSGDYVMKGANTGAYVLGDSATLAAGLTIFNSDWIIMGWDSDTGAEIIPTVYYPTESYTISNVVVYAEDVDGYEDISTLEKITYTLTSDSDSTVTTTITYSYFIVPTEVTAEKSSHFSIMEIGLLAVIPVIMLIAVLLVAVRGLTRYD